MNHVTAYFNQRTIPSYDGKILNNIFYFLCLLNRERKVKRAASEEINKLISVHFNPTLDAQKISRALGWSTILEILY